MMPLSRIGLGCNNFGMKLDRNASAAVVHAALDAGITHFDTAEMYGGGQSEEHLGAALGIGIVPYFPLASGLLTGKYRAGTSFPAGSRLDAMPYFASVATDENFALIERLTEYAEARGHTVLELAVAWLLAHDSVASVICGATTPEQVEANVAAAWWHLDADEFREIDERLAVAS